MHNRGYRMFVEQMLEQIPVSYITFNENGFTAAYLPNLFVHGGVTVAQVIQYGYVMAGIEQRNTGM
jgi:hypothetical protein